MPPGGIRNLGFSYHGDIKVFDYSPLPTRRTEMGFRTNPAELRRLETYQSKYPQPDAEYLYGELVKRGIPAVIMEPLLGGRLSKLNDHLMARLKQRRPQDSVASWAFRFAGTFPDVLTVLSGMTYMEHLQDNLRTFSPLDPCTEEEMALLEDTAQMMLTYPPFRATTANTVCLVPTVWTSPPYCCITTDASTRAMCLKAVRTRTIAKHAAPSSSAMTAAYRSFARQVIVPDATNATRIVRRALIFPKSYRK